MVPSWHWSPPRRRRAAVRARKIRRLIVACTLTLPIVLPAGAWVASAIPNITAPAPAPSCKPARMVTPIAVAPL